MQTKQLAPLANVKLIRNRIFAVAKKNPAKPLKGHGNDRVQFNLPLVFAKLRTLAPLHCETVTHRGAINGFGKLGFIPNDFISPELSAVISANIDEFEKLERGFQIAVDFGI